MTTPSAPPASTTPAPAAVPLTDALTAAVVAIARHITGRAPGDEASALAAFGLTSDQAEAITARKS